MPRSKLRAVQRYLEKAELSEPDAWYRDDYRQAWILLNHLDADDPYLYSFTQMYGCTPDKLAQKQTQQRERVLRSTVVRPKAKTAAA